MNKVIKAGSFEDFIDAPTWANVVCKNRYGQVLYSESDRTRPGERFTVNGIEHTYSKDREVEMLTDIIAVRSEAWWIPSSRNYDVGDWCFLQNDEGRTMLCKIHSYHDGIYHCWDKYNHRNMMVESTKKMIDIQKGITTNLSEAIECNFTEEGQIPKHIVPQLSEFLVSLIKIGFFQGLGFKEPE